MYSSSKSRQMERITSISKSTRRMEHHHNKSEKPLVPLKNQMITMNILQRNETESYKNTFTSIISNQLISPKHFFEVN